MSKEPTVRHNEHGFTLVELLIAVSLLAMLSLVLFSGMHLGTQIWRRSEETTTEANRIRSVRISLSDLLDRIYPEFVSPSPTSGYVKFDGNEHRLAFLAPDPFRPGALEYVSLLLSFMNGRSVFVQSSRPELGPSAMSKVTVLLSHTRSLEFAYYGPDSTSGAPYWHSTWRQRSRLPQIVRVRLLMDDKGYWPDLSVAPRIAADTSCTFSTITHYCAGRQ